MKKAILLFLFFCPFIIFGQSKNYTKGGTSEKIVGEYTTLAISTIESTIDDPEENSLTLAGMIGLVVPLITNIGDKVIKAELGKSVKQFSGEFSAKMSSQGFYETEGVANLPKLTIERKVKLKNASGYVTASKIILVPELAIDKSAFRYMVDTVIYKWTKAKTKSKYDLIDVNVEVDIKYYSMKGETSEIKTLRNVNIAIPQVVLDGKAYTDNPSGNKLWQRASTEWIPFPPYPRATEKGVTTTSFKEVKTTIEKADGKKETSTKTEEIKIKEDNKEKTRPLYAKSLLYEVSVTVKEVNPYKVRAEEVKEYVDGQPISDYGAALGGLLETILTKEEVSSEAED